MALCLFNCLPMNAFRCLGLLVFVLLSACDKPQEPVVPKPKTQAAQSVAPAPAPSSVPAAAPVVEQAPAMPAAPVVSSTLDKPVAEAVTGSVVDAPAAPVHQLTPNIPVVPVVIGKGDSGVTPKAAEVRPEKDKAAKVAKAPAASEQAKPAAVKPAAKTLTKREQQAQKRQSANKTAAVAKETGLGKTRLDLSLPPKLVQGLEPPPKVITARRKPLLPPMFSDKAAAEDPNGFELNGRLLSNEMQLQMRNDSRRDVEGAALDFKFKQ